MSEDEAAEAAKPAEPVKTIGDQRPAAAVQTTEERKAAS